MTAADPILFPSPVHRLLPGQTLRLYLDRTTGIQLEQGAVQLVSHEWVAERCLAMTQQLDAGAAYQPDASGWVSVQALAGGAVVFRMMRRPGWLALCITRLLCLLGAVRFLRPQLKS